MVCSTAMSLSIDLFGSFRSPCSGFHGFPISGPRANPVVWRLQQHGLVERS